MKALWVRAATSPQPTDLIMGTLLCVAIAVLCALLQTARTELTRRLDRHRRLLLAAQRLPPPEAPGVSTYNPTNASHIQPTLTSPPYPPTQAMVPNAPAPAAPAGDGFRVHRIGIAAGGPIDIHAAVADRMLAAGVQVVDADVGGGGDEEPPLRGESLAHVLPYTMLLTNTAVLCALVALPCSLGRLALTHLAALQMVRSRNIRTPCARSLMSVV
jgi:hypothetical protein